MLTSLSFGFQVLSPITGHVLGSTEVRVVKSKETITDLKVRVVSGISLVVQPDAASGGLHHQQQNQFVLKTILSEKLSTKYQVSFKEDCATTDERVTDEILIVRVAGFFFREDATSES